MRNRAQSNVKNALPHNMCTFATKLKNSLSKQIQQSTTGLLVADKLPGVYPPLSDPTLAADLEFLIILCTSFAHQQPQVCAR